MWTELGWIPACAGMTFSRIGMLRYGSRPAPNPVSPAHALLISRRSPAADMAWTLPGHGRGIEKREGGEPGKCNNLAQSEAQRNPGFGVQMCKLAPRGRHKSLPGLECHPCGADPPNPHPV